MKNRIKFFNEVVFVAIKNGMHDSRVMFLSRTTKFKYQKNRSYSKLHDIILSIFSNLDNNLKKII